MESKSAEQLTTMDEEQLDADDDSGYSYGMICNDHLPISGSQTLQSGEKGLGNNLAEKCLAEICGSLVLSTE